MTKEQIKACAELLKRVPVTGMEAFTLVTIMQALEKEFNTPEPKEE